MQAHISDDGPVASTIGAPSRRPSSVSLDGGLVVPSRGLRQLGGLLEASGLAAFLAAFPPHSTRRNRWRREAEDLDAELRALVRLFALGEPVRTSALPPLVVEALAPLVVLGLAEVDTDARLRNVVLGRPLGIWLLAEPAALVVDHYFGPDSIALAMHATYGAGATCLDLCAGPGFQGLAALARCRRVVLIEVQAASAGLAAVNLAVNGLEERADVRCGDLFEPLDDDLFDHVVANVPFIPVPSGCPFPMAGTGGEDGFAVARRVLDGLWEHLEPDGSAHLATLLLRGDRGLLLADELEEWARANECAVHVSLTSTMPLGRGSGLVKATAAAIAACSASPFADLIETVAANYERRGARSAGWAFLRIDRRSRGLRVMDIGGGNPLAPWISVS
jgi:release factor glutamine methyltransferase